MKKFLSLAAALLLTGAFSILALAADAAEVSITITDENNNSTAAVNDARDVVDGVVCWNLSSSGNVDIQDWINGALTENAGTTSEFYILALRQSGTYDFTSYEAALMDYLENNTIRSASSRLKYALVLHAIGSTDDDITEALNDSIGQQGIMSWVYGLHIMNNGIVCDTYTTDEVIRILLDLQLEDGGWSLTGESGDVDVTAMTVQALAPYYETNADVKEAIAHALTLLSSRQQEDGGYASYGVSNPESASQVLVALSALGIDCTEDARFIKNGNTLFDGILKYRLADGSFCHKEGNSSNHTATVQAYYAMISYLRMVEGKTPLYILDTDFPDAEIPAETEETPPTAPETTGLEMTDLTPVEPAPEDTSAADTTEELTEKPNRKPLVCLIVLCVGGVVCLIFFATGKRHPKNFIAIALLTGIAVVIVLTTDFQSADEYYSGNSVVKENAIGTVTLTIRCDTIVGKSDSSYIPADGIILDVTAFAIEEGDSVYDILTEAAQKYHIQIESTGQWDMIYIAGIQYLYEFDFGDLSGWVYHVNGDAPSVGCGEYILSDGDAIEWLYTCDLGNDVK